MFIQPKPECLLLVNRAPSDAGKMTVFYLKFVIAPSRIAENNPPSPDATDLVIYPVDDGGRIARHRSTPAVVGDDDVEVRFQRYGEIGIISHSNPPFRCLFRTFLSRSLEVRK